MGQESSSDTKLSKKINPYLPPSEPDTERKLGSMRDYQGVQLDPNAKRFSSGFDPSFMS